MRLFSIGTKKHQSEDIMIKYKTIPEFDKDFKALSKRFKTLPDDFETLKRFILETHYEQDIPTTAFLPIEGCCAQEYTSNKIKKFACKSLKGKGSASGLRVIFVWDKESRAVTFIEIYFKADQENENKKRLKEFLTNHYKTGD